MWTPRRILLLVVGVGLCTAAFVLYNRFLGWIDGLPALPERYLATAKPGGEPIQPRGNGWLDQMLHQAFGDNCPEADYNYKNQLRAQGLVVAFHEWRPDQGDIIVWPLSIASFGKINPKTGFPEINAVRCDRARIKFGHPVATLSDITRSRVEAVDFFAEPAADGAIKRAGKIYVIHNHSTPQGNDDLIISTVGPVHFVDKLGQSPNEPNLWSDKPIDVDDFAAEPAHYIKAARFRLFLANDKQKAGDKSVQGRESGVRRIELDQVDMRLTVDKQSDFLDSGAPSARTAEPKATLTIRTQGRFEYDVQKGHAEFLAGERTTYLPQYVEVVRNQRQVSDELRCDRLQLEFNPKANEKNSPAARDPGNSLALKEVHATGRKVVVISADQQLSAVGTELIFRQDAREVVLRGSPMSAVKEGTRIEASRLFLHRPDPNLPATPAIVRLARAPGPGTMYVNEQASGSVEVRWKDELLMEREGLQNRVTFTGQAVFDDSTHNRLMQGDQIRIWFSPDSAPTTAGPRPLGQSKPERVRVAGRVEARTPEFIVTDTPLLDVWFKEVDKPIMKVAAAAGQPSFPAQSSAGAQPAAPNPPVPPKKPVRLSAEYIEAFVHRHEDRKTRDNQFALDRVNCRRRVHVLQDAVKPKERGLDVRADELDMTHQFDNLNLLELRGVPDVPVHVEVQELTLEGPKIVVDQAGNRADVVGAGLAILQVQTNLSGEKLAQPTDVVIHWLGKMDFRGNRVSFHGGVQADQEGETRRAGQVEHEVNRLICCQMDIYLDKSVAFSPDNRRATAPRDGAEEQPKVKRVVCHRGDDTAFDRHVTVAGNVWRNGKRIRFQQIDAPEVTFENDTREVTATCTERTRGEMRVWSNERTGLDDNPSPGSAAASEFNLTHIVFRKQMRASEKSHSVVFTGSVRVWRGPANDPHLAIDFDKLPDKAFTLTCQSLEIGQQPKAWMSAEGKADINAKDFAGSADKIKYDEAKKQQIIFDSSDGIPASLSHIKEKGKPPMVILGRQIIYWRETNDFRGSGLVGASGAK